MPSTRRNFLQNTAAAALASTASAKPKATADTCIFVWLPGGMCHLDTFDPKSIGDGATVPGSYYKSIPTSVSGLEFCEHLPLLAKKADRLAVLRTLNHSFTDHTRAVDFVHTGRQATGTVVYPSIGSIVAHELGGLDPRAPAYVVVGEPMQPRGPGFLGGKANYLYITDTEAGPEGLQIPKGLSLGDYSQRRQDLAEFSADFRAKHNEGPIADYSSVASHAFEMMDPKFQSAFTVNEEPAELREAYGGEFGQRLLLSRRLVERGVRFVECSFNIKFINGYGWDTHAFSQKRVHLMIRQLDRALNVLMEDLDRKKMFDRTLIVLATEFGRPPEFDGQGGRGHQSSVFSGVLFGGGIRGGKVVGVSDELGRMPKERPVSIPDFHATIHHTLGLDPEKHLFTPDGRPVPITDYGTAISEIL